MDARGGEGLRVFGEAVAIVTGGASGIGAALGRELARRGSRVVLADRDEEGVRAEADRLAAGSARAEAVALDVRDAEAVEGVVARTFETHGRLDYLFNNAGIGVGGWAEELDLERDWRYTVEVNLMGPVHGVQAAYPRMVKQGFGHIVNTASMAAFMATALTAPYGTTKHAVVGLSRALRVEGALRGVRVSVLCPGVIRTPILQDGGKYGRAPITDLSAETKAAMWERLRPMAPEVFAVKVLDAVARNKGIIIVPAWWHALRLLNVLFPSLSEALGRRELRRMAPLLHRQQAGD
ncbi:MAG: SDR family oxidoreductase [Acidobacteria bacterium]|jgi:NAD(P)-dependent dehydrogenase (short-subunit alcohol dehydrogenase family)|nr:SDR family oxidoreductase [Acidobacteriota bacterium]